MNTSSIARGLRPVIVLLLIAAVAGAGVWWFVLRPNAAASGELTASGTIEAQIVRLAPEMGGRVTEIAVDEGQAVTAGQVLIKLDDTTLQAQYAQAKAALQTTQASLALLQAGPSPEQRAAQIAQAEEAVLIAQQALQALKDSAAAAQAQAQLVVAQAQDGLDKAKRDLTYARHPASQSLYDTVRDTQVALDTAQANLQLTNVSQDQSALDSQTFITNWFKRRLDDLVAKYGTESDNPDVRDRITQAQNDYQSQLDKQLTLELRINTTKANVSNTVAQTQTAYDHAVTNLQSAQAGPDANRVAIAQAKVALAQETLDNAQTYLQKIGAGPDPDKLAAAQAHLASTQAVWAAAKAGPSAEQLAVAQAQVASTQAQVQAIEAQLKKLVLIAPVDGIVLSRAIEPGELASPGATVLEIGKINQLEVTIYLPEDKFALVTPGETATLQVDAYPNRSFTATVLKIADQAQFTPRNVQTVEGRKDTVFAVRLSIANPDLALKPGMPADVNFGHK